MYIVHPTPLVAQVVPRVAVCRTVGRCLGSGRPTVSPSSSLLLFFCFFLLSAPPTRWIISFPNDCSRLSSSSSRGEAVICASSLKHVTLFNRWVNNVIKVFSVTRANNNFHNVNKNKMFAGKKVQRGTFASSSRSSCFMLILIQSHLSPAAAFPFSSASFACISKEVSLFRYSQLHRYHRRADGFCSSSA